MIDKYGKNASRLHVNKELQKEIILYRSELGILTGQTAEEIEKKQA